MGFTYGLSCLSFGPVKIKKPLLPLKQKGLFYSKNNISMKRNLGKVIGYSRYETANVNIC